MNKYDKSHLSHLNRYEKQITDLFATAVDEAAKISMVVQGVNDKPFSWNDFPLAKKKADKLIEKLQGDIQIAIVNGIRNEWSLSNIKNDALCNSVFKDLTLPTKQSKKYYNNNAEALEQFIARKNTGLNLSDRVWNYTQQFKQEIELALDLGIRSGKSADELSRDLRSYLKYPNKLFRRVRDEHGELHLSKTAKAFHPGQGVYRSSYMNARRLAATETNIAYRTADYTRWQEMDFVVGIEIHLSNNHNCKGVPAGMYFDICDELKGRYPKEFKFAGWHPHCRCYATSILKSQEEIQADNERILNGERLTNNSVNAVANVPDNFNKWIENNSERIKRAKSLPYFIKDNFKDSKIEEGLKDVKYQIREWKDNSLEYNLKGVILSYKNLNNITDEEVKNTITNFAKNNPALFNSGLKEVLINRDKIANFFMANSRVYTSTRGYDMKGNTIIITDRDFNLTTDEIFNPLEEVKGALKAIATDVDMTFNQEYALESLWHEIRHAGAVGWGDISNITKLRKDIMETINQFCARHSYGYFVKSLGGKANHIYDIIKGGYGYSDKIANFQHLLKYMNITQEEAYSYFKDIIQQQPYEKIYGILVKFVRQSIECNLTEAGKITKMMTKLEPKYFIEFLNNFMDV